MTAAAPAWAGPVRAAEALLFDFDGTLAPNLDLPDLRRRVTALTLARGVPETAFRGHYIVEMLDAGADWLAPLNPEAAAALQRDGHRLIRDFELEAAGRTAPFPRVREALTLLRGHGKRLAVVTRNCRDAVLAVFPDIEDYCHSVLARDDVAHLKPDVRHMERALETLGSRPGRAVMVGDGQLDMRIGKSLGMYCVGVTSGSHDAARLREAGADAVVAFATDLARALQGHV